MSSLATRARELLARADSESAIARWAEGMRVSIRLGCPVLISEMHQRGPLGRKHRYVYDLDDRMPPAATDGLYRVLCIVRDEAHEKSAALEAEAFNVGQVTT